MFPGCQETGSSTLAGIRGAAAWAPPRWRSIVYLPVSVG
jgi:hypothetical protein